MLVEDERYTIRLAKAAIRETNAVALDELSWRGPMRVGGQGKGL
jgi:hypothetical protein